MKRRKCSRTRPELAVRSILVSLAAAGPEGQASLSPPVTHTHTHTPDRKIRAADDNQVRFWVYQTALRRSHEHTLL